MPGERLPTPGLKWRARKDGPPAAYWIAKPEIVKLGFTPKTAQIHYNADDPDFMVGISDRCRALDAEQREFLAQPHGGRHNTGAEGTIGYIVDQYISDSESPFVRLKAATKLPYLHYARLIIETIGERRMIDCDGRDVRRWFLGWSDGGKLAKANTCIAILKSALGYGVMCRRPHCADLREIIRVMQFEHPAPRKSAPTREQIQLLRTKAHEKKHPAIALAVALQFETMQRLWDIIGQWLPISDPMPSAVLSGREKWIGPQWSDISPDMILRWTPTKTAGTTAVSVECDLKLCPMAMEEIARIPESERRGPLIKRKDGLPYPRRCYQRSFRTIAEAAELPATLWSRDIRAGAITDARRNGASLEDTSKAAGHADTGTTAKIYDRGALDAHRRVAAARTKNTP